MSTLPGVRKQLEWEWAEGKQGGRDETRLAAIAAPPPPQERYPSPKLTAPLLRPGFGVGPLGDWTQVAEEIQTSGSWELISTSLTPATGTGTPTPEIPIMS